ncbi:hypothetical protein FSB73_18620 [Arachidicoccus ginsenosidivorans]|jgi:hypothetical protein|uniref:Uncharacterized protein n=1 Tax=Arachidicoccus ginsenosidivorans TaxID=496057 RepID=A0A5B8VRM9_9BACT|nr:hypothetical protein [Arachidicoccus ginsenosidivorans]QEC73376.1 hypothetical protein FSB73_18620 [Arachidicoccus ginsenosidivorans]
MQSKLSPVFYLNLPPYDQFYSVLKECDYGCVVCGAPICYVCTACESKVTGVDYRLLCQKHLPNNLQGIIEPRSLKNVTLPDNIKRSKSQAEDILHYNDRESLSVIIGMVNMIFEKRAESEEQVIFPITIDCFPVLLITLIDSHILFDICLLDEFNNEVLLVRSNMILFCGDGIDISFDKKRLLIKNKDRVLVNIEFSDNSVRLVEGYFLLSGVKLEINSTSISVNNSAIEIPDDRGNENNPLGISIGRNNMPTALIDIEQVNRYL